MYKPLIVFFVTFLAALNALATDVEANIKAALQKRRPDIPVVTVAKTPLPGIYEVYAGGQIYYTDEQARYIFDGHLFDMERNVNMTDDWMLALLKEAHKINVDSLPYNLAIKQVKGNGTRKLVIFTDPDCPYCRKLQHELESVNNVTIYYFLFPIASLHPNAPKMAREIWCAPNRSQAWVDYMIRNVPPKNDGSCATPIETLAILGKKIKVDGTPTIFDAHGDYLPGTPTAQQLEQHLALAQQSAN